MQTFKYGLFIWAILLGVFSFCSAQNSSFSYADSMSNSFTTFNNIEGVAVYDDKIYIQPEQLIISSEGIFFVTQDLILPINQLNADCQGLFIPQVSPWGKCPNGHPVKCPNCIGCGNNCCAHRCKCPLKKTR
jgi:hypothetical protein